MSEPHAATVLLAIGADDATMTVALDCDVCGRAELHCARRHLALLAQLLMYAAAREGGRGTALTMSEDR